MKWRDEIRKGKGRVILSEQRVRALVARYRPHGWRIHQKSNMPYYDGLSHYPEQIIEVPLLVCNFSIFTLFHEVGHVNRGHFANWDRGDHPRTIPGHVEEYEAENYAYHLMRAEALPMTAAMVVAMRWNVGIYARHDKWLDIPLMPYCIRGMRRWRASN